MSNILNFPDITPQEEIFCQYYVQTVDIAFSSYHAGFNQQIKNKTEYKDLTKAQIQKLKNYGNEILKKKVIIERISNESRMAARKNKKAQLDEVLGFLTAVMRKAMSKNLENTTLVRLGIDAAAIYVKHFPNFEGGAKTEERIIFNRHRKVT